MMKIKTVYVILTTMLTEDGDIEVKISQEAYNSYEKAKNFCLSRIDVQQVGEFNFCSKYEDVRYAIVPVSVV